MELETTGDWSFNLKVEYVACHFGDSEGLLRDQVKNLEQDMRGSNEERDIETLFDNLEARILPTNPDS